MSAANCTTSNCTSSSSSPTSSPSLPATTVASFYTQNLQFFIYGFVIAGFVLLLVFLFLLRTRYDARVRRRYAYESEFDVRKEVQRNRKRKAKREEKKALIAAAKRAGVPIHTLIVQRTRDAMGMGWQHAGAAHDHHREGGAGRGQHKRAAMVMDGKGTGVRGMSGAMTGGAEWRGRAGREASVKSDGRGRGLGHGGKRRSAGSEADGEESALSAEESDEHSEEEAESHESISHSAVVQPYVPVKPLRLDYLNNTP
jgi:hypothetical protein